MATCNKVFQRAANDKAVKVVFDRRCREYVVMTYRAGRHNMPSDYFTDDRSEAIALAKAYLLH